MGETHSRQLTWAADLGYQPFLLIQSIFQREVQIEIWVQESDILVTLVSRCPHPWPKKQPHQGLLWSPTDLTVLLYSSFLSSTLTVTSSLSACQAEVEEMVGGFILRAGQEEMQERERHTHRVRCWQQKDSVHRDCPGVFCPLLFSSLCPLHGLCMESFLRVSDKCLIEIPG